VDIYEHVISFEGYSSAFYSKYTVELEYRNESCKFNSLGKHPVSAFFIYPVRVDQYFHIPRLFLCRWRVWYACRFM